MDVLIHPRDLCFDRSAGSILDGVRQLTRAGGHVWMEGARDGEPLRIEGEYGRSSLSQRLFVKPWRLCYVYNLYPPE